MSGVASALVATALAAGLRADAEAADARRDWPAALAAWERCAAEAPDRDARFCEIRRAALAPHAADGFAGWDVLEGVRRDYRTLGSDAAMAEIEAALAAAPEGPAAPAMRLWLANEHNRRGDAVAVERLGQEMAADARTPGAAVRYVQGIGVHERLEARRRAIGVAGAVLGVGYALVALVRPGPLKWRSAATAGVVLGLVPAGFAALYEEGMAGGFLLVAIVLTGAVLGAARAPWWVAVPGTLGGVAAVAWANGWYPSLGL